MAKQNVGDENEICYDSALHIHLLPSIATSRALKPWFISYLTMTAIMTALFGALTLTNACYFERVGVKDFTNDTCVRDYDWPEFVDLQEYIRLEVDKSGHVEETLEVGSEAPKMKSTKSMRRQTKPLPTIQEADEGDEAKETGEVEASVPRHIIM